MNKTHIFILLLILPLTLNALSSCKIKGGVINKIDDRPYFVVQHKDNSKQFFSYNDTYKEDCIKNINALYKNNNTILKENRIYIISFSIKPIDKGKILSIEEELKIKVKVRNKNDSTRVKALIRSDMKKDNHSYTSFGNTKEFNYYSEFITHIESFFGTTKVLDMYTSPNLSQYQVLNFNLNKDFKKKNIKFIVTNNKNLKRTFFKNKQKNESNVINTNKKFEAVFNAKSQDEAIEKMYGIINEFKEGNITIQSPKVAANGQSVPLGIISNIEAESILVLTDSTWYPVVFAIVSTPYNKIDYRLKLNLNYKEVWKYKIVVIIKDKKGNYYKAEKKSDVVHYTSCS